MPTICITSKGQLGVLYFEGVILCCTAKTRFYGYTCGVYSQSYQSGKKKDQQVVTGGLAGRLSSRELKLLHNLLAEGGVGTQLSNTIWMGGRGEGHFDGFLVFES